MQGQSVAAKDKNWETVGCSSQEYIEVDTWNGREKEEGVLKDGPALDQEEKASWK